jgi:hypothetical protein
MPLVGWGLVERTWKQKGEIRGEVHDKMMGPLEKDKKPWAKGAAAAAEGKVDCGVVCAGGAETRTGHLPGQQVAI